MLAVAATSLVAVAAVACGSSSEPEAAPTIAPPPPVAAAPSPVTPAAPAPAASPAQPAASAPAPTAAARNAPAETTIAEPTTPVAEAAEAAARYSWEVSVVDNNGAKPSLDMAPDGTPHVAYLLEAMPGFVKHTVREAGGWDITTVDTGYYYGPLDVQVDSQGVPHVAWHDHDNEDAAYARLVNGEWQVSLVENPGHDGWDTNLAIDSQGRPTLRASNRSSSAVNPG